MFKLPLFQWKSLFVITFCSKKMLITKTSCPQFVAFFTIYNLDWLVSLKQVMMMMIKMIRMMIVQKNGSFEKQKKSFNEWHEQYALSVGVKNRGQRPRKRFVNISLVGVKTPCNLHHLDLLSSTLIMYYWIVCRSEMVKVNSKRAKLVNKEKLSSKCKLNWVGGHDARE